MVFGITLLLVASLVVFGITLLLVASLVVFVNLRVSSISYNGMGLLGNLRVPISENGMGLLGHLF